MKFGLRHAHDMHTQVFVHAIKAKFHYAIQLASSSRTSSRAGRELDGVMEFWSRAGLRPASELYSVMEFGFNSMTHL